MKERMGQSTGFEKHLRRAAEPILFSTAVWASVARQTAQKMEQSGMKDVLRTRTQGKILKALPNHPDLALFIATVVFPF